MPVNSVSLIEPWRKRLVLGLAIFAGIFSLAVVAAITWAILYIHSEKAAMEHVPAKIISINSSQRSSSGRSIKFGKYNITVQYRLPDGSLDTASFSKNTYGFPSAGDSITLLIGEYGHVESDPFPELWIVLLFVYIGFGALIWFFAKVLLAIRRW